MIVLGMTFIICMIAGGLWFETKYWEDKDND